MNPWLILAGIVLAVAVVAACRAVRPGRQADAPPRVWDADTQRWTTEPSTAAADLDACELLWTLPEYQRPAPSDHTTTEGDL